MNSASLKLIVCVGVAGVMCNGLITYMKKNKNVKRRDKHCNKECDSILDVWLLMTFKPHPSVPFPLLPTSGKLMRKPSAPPFSPTKHTAALYAQDSSPQQCLLLTVKAEPVSFKSFWTCLGSHPAFPRKPCYVSNKPVHILLVASTEQI